MAGKVIEVPGVGVVEFPAGMGDDEIIAEIGKMKPPPPAPDPLQAHEGLAHGGADAIPGGQKAVAVGTALTNALIKAMSSNPAYQRLSTDPTEQLAYEREKLARSEKEQPGDTLLGKVAGGATGYAAAGAYAPARLVQAMGAAPAAALTYGALRGGANADRLSEMLPRAAKEGIANASVAGLGSRLGDALSAAKARNLAGRLEWSSLRANPSVTESVEELPGGVEAAGNKLLDLGTHHWTKAGTADAVQAAFDANAPKISGALEAAQAGGAKPPYPTWALNLAKRDVVAPMLTNAESSGEATGGRAAAALLDEWKAIERAGKPTFESAQLLKGRIGDEAYGAGENFVKSGAHDKGYEAKALRQAYGLVNDNIKSALGKASPGLLEQYESGNLAHQQLGLALRAANRTAARSSANLKIGLPDILAADAMASSGHGALAIPTAIAERLTREYGNHFAALGLRAGARAGEMLPVPFPAVSGATAPLSAKLSDAEMEPLLRLMEAHAKTPEQQKQDALADAIRWRKE